MANQIILASSSDIRARLLRNAGVTCEVIPARIDEDSIKRALEAEAATPRDIADTLAEMKARKVAEKGVGATWAAYDCRWQRAAAEEGGKHCDEAGGGRMFVCDEEDS